MLKKLRLKIILAIVLVAAVMLGAILGLFYTLTKQNLRTQSISMMQAIAADPFAPVQPEREPQQVRLPYFVLQTDAFGNLVAIGSSDYDLTDRTFLRMVAAAAQASRDAIGEIPEYSLRYCRVTGSVIFADHFQRAADAAHAFEDRRAARRARPACLFRPCGAAGAQCGPASGESVAAAEAVCRRRVARAENAADRHSDKHGAAAKPGL